VTVHTVEPGVVTADGEQDRPFNDGPVLCGIVTVPPLPVEGIELPAPDDDAVLTTLIIEEEFDVVGETVKVAVATVPSAIAVEFIP
jgi:hypothetical protein